MAPYPATSMSEFPRLFDPPEQKMPGFRVSNLLATASFRGQNCNWRNLQRVNYHDDTVFLWKMVSSMVISIDGACRGNGTPRARAAWGVHFDENSPYNCQGRVPDGCRQTSQYALIFAAMKALERAETVMAGKPWIKHVVLVTDSSYLALSMSKYIYDWQENGWASTVGEQVTNKKGFKRLHSMMKKIEDNGIIVQFWQVSRESNKEADGLANLALNQIDDRRASDHTAQLATKAMEEGGPRPLMGKYAQRIRPAQTTPQPSDTPRTLYAVSAFVW